MSYMSTYRIFFVTPQIQNDYMEVCCVMFTSWAKHIKSYNLESGSTSTLMIVISVGQYIKHHN
jgi:hypothetical protein